MQYNKWIAKYIGVNIPQRAGRLKKLKREDKSDIARSDPKKEKKE